MPKNKKDAIQCGLFIAFFIALSVDWVSLI